MTGDRELVTGHAGQLWFLPSVAAVITAVVAAAGCSTAACTAHNAGPAAAESTPLAALTDTHQRSRFNSKLNTTSRRLYTAETECNKSKHEKCLNMSF